MLHRFRNLILLVAVTVLAWFVLPRIQAQPAVGATVIAVHDSLASHHSAPVSPHPIPVESIALVGIVGATRRATRRKSNARTDIPLYLDSIVHVQRKNDETGKMETVAINGGVLVDDTDLSDDEVDELTAMRAIRHATPEEIARLERQDDNTERAELVAKHAAEMDALKASNESERAVMVADASTSPEALTKLDKRHVDAVDKLAAKHAKALEKFDAQ